jgi:hypothetical protein
LEESVEAAKVWGKYKRYPTRWWVWSDGERLEVETDSRRLPGKPQGLVELRYRCSEIFFACPVCKEPHTVKGILQRDDCPVEKRIKEAYGLAPKLVESVLLNKDLDWKGYVRRKGNEAKKAASLLGGKFLDWAKKRLTPEEYAKVLSWVFFSNWHEWKFKCYGWLRCQKCGEEVNYIDLQYDRKSQRLYVSECKG